MNLQAYLHVDDHKQSKKPLIPPLAFAVNLYRCVAPQVPSLPAMIIVGQLPAINITLSGSMIPQLIALATSFGSISTASKAALLPDHIIVTDTGEHHSQALSSLSQHELWRVTEFELTQSEVAKILKSDSEARDIMQQLDTDG